jgi:hypothetical protein
MAERESTSSHQEEGGATPLCSRCLTPFRPGQHYCERCGWAVGKYTPYIPYVNIRFNYGWVGATWKKIWFDRETKLAARAFYLFLMILAAPVIMVGLPFVLVEKIRRRTRKKDEQ